MTKIIAEMAMMVRKARDSCSGDMPASRAACVRVKWGARLIVIRELDAALLERGADGFTVGLGD